jgi:hypothetical protein
MMIFSTVNNYLPLLFYPSTKREILNTTVTQRKVGVIVSRETFVIPFSVHVHNYTKSKILESDLHQVLAICTSYVIELVVPHSITPLYILAAREYQPFGRATFRSIVLAHKVGNKGGEEVRYCSTNTQAVTGIFPVRGSHSLPRLYAV